MKNPIMRNVIDLHCDTITTADADGNLASDPLYNNTLAMDFHKVPKDTLWAQCHAIFMPDEYRGADAIAFYEKMVKRYKEQTAQHSDTICPVKDFLEIESGWEQKKHISILTVEGGSALAGDLSRVQTLASDGVRIMTLVWNGQNEIASGSTTENGFSDIGKTVIPELEKCGIIIDVSHLNDTGFWELLELVNKPFAATHSNARAICSHKRNLTDDMICEMVRRGCLIGLNYYTAFLSNDDSCDYADAFFQHIQHFIKLGAAKNLALGSDFDGADLPDCLSSPEKVMEMYDYLLGRGISAEVLDDIYYRNALLFLKKFQ